jgi:subtilisin-like proprotein convertase family protein
MFIKKILEIILSINIDKPFLDSCLVNLIAPPGSKITSIDYVYREVEEDKDMWNMRMKNLIYFA